MARFKLLKRLAVPQTIMINNRPVPQRNKSIDAFSEKALAEEGFLTDDGKLDTQRVFNECDVITAEAEHADEVTEVQQVLAEFAEAIGFEGEVRDSTAKLENPTGFKHFSVGKRRGSTSASAKKVLSFLS